MKRKLLAVILSALMLAMVIPSAGAAGYSASAPPEKDPPSEGVMYTLQDSTVVGSWSDSYLDYNCYAYAVGRTDAAYWPGMFSYTPSRDDFDVGDSIYSMAYDTRADLKSSEFSMKCVKLTSTRPTSVQSGQKCICIRKGSDDFHFMKLSGSSWYHKPGQSIPLKYKYVPTTSRDWTNECSMYGAILAPSATYDSTIYYLIYKVYHGEQTRCYTGENYHSGRYHYYQYAYVCDDCGETVSLVWEKESCSGPPCPLDIRALLEPETHKHED